MTNNISRREFAKRSTLASSFLSGWPARVFAENYQPLQRKSSAKKVIVLGAGLAGLSAAYELTQAGHDVTILEARTRPGGRVHTLRDAFSDGLYAEAGATRIPDNHDFTLRYVKLFNLPLEPFQPPGLPTVYHLRGKRLLVKPSDKVDWPLNLTEEEKKLGLDGMRRKYLSSDLNELGDVTAPNWPPPSLRKYDLISLKEYLRTKGLSPDAIHLIRINGGGPNNPVDPYSMLTGMRTRALGASSTYFKITGGTDHLPKAFAKLLADKIHYGTPVVRVERGADKVQAVFLRGGAPQTISGDYLICTIPFSVLKNIEVTPPFTPEKRKAIEEQPYYSTSKIYFQTRKRFWEAEGANGFAFTDMPINQIWHMTYNQPSQRGILAAYPKLLDSEQVTAMKENERIRFALEQVEKAYPGTLENVEGAVTKCWDEDPWARGSSAVFKVGQLTEFVPHMARPEGRVHFAGEHTSMWRGGWMQGAFESGNRVAKEINEAS